MSQLESISFPFRSQNYETPAEFMRDMGIQDEDTFFRTVLYYYNTYLGVKANPHQILIITEDKMQGGYELNDHDTPFHDLRGIVTLTADLTDVHHLAAVARIDDIRDLMTHALIFLEKFKDAVDKGWSPAIVDHDQNTITYLRMVNPQHHAGFAPGAPKLQ